MGGARPPAAESRAGTPSGEILERAVCRLLRMREDRAHARSLDVAIVGATGLVGGVLLEVLGDSSFPIGRLRPLARDAGNGRRVTFRGEELSVEAAGREALRGADLVFFAATGELSRELVPVALEEGARVVDKSSVFRGDPDVPLVVPEVNGDAIAGDTRLVASPNCTTIGLVLALEPLRRAAGLKRVVVTTLQAASGAGRAGLDALERGTAFPSGDGSAAPLERNVLPVCDSLGPDGSTAEEHKLLAETRRILDDPGLELTVTCTRVPVAVGHGAAVSLWTEAPLSVEEARAALEATPWIRLVDQPTPRQVAGRDEVLVGR
ncbi:MAG TPA: aspartate-semialdehyde dehydrogenase, partial [Planctomycetes bacterium]|nr:aspartate-semialdehyde dehydrogenase [Planctomycetota bacterium]